MEGPTGSSTTASSAKSANHPSRSLASVSAMDCLAMSRATPIGNPLTRQPFGTSRRTAGSGDDGVSEPPQVIELGLERLDVGTDGVGPPETDDHVGHTLFLEAPHSVDAVGVERYRVHFERFVLASGLGPQLAQPGQHPGQGFGVATSVHP